MRTWRETGHQLWGGGKAPWPLALTAPSPSKYTFQKPEKCNPSGLSLPSPLPWAITLELTWLAGAYSDKPNNAYAGYHVSLHKPPKNVLVQIPPPSSKQNLFKTANCSAAP